MASRAGWLKEATEVLDAASGKPGANNLLTDRYDNLTASICYRLPMRNDLEVRIELGDRERLEAVLADRDSAQTYAWRARSILA